MTKDVREQILELYRNCAGDDCNGKAGCKEHKYDCAICFSDQILTLLKENGYVKLADDQELPECTDYWRSWGYSQAQQDMLKAGWKKVKVVEQMTNKGRKKALSPCGSFTCNQIDKCDSCVHGIKTLPEKEEK